MHKIAGKFRLVAMVMLFGVLSACATQFRNHGYAPRDADLAQIVVGQDSRETVAELVGRPTTSGILDESTWYYVESRFRHFAFTAPTEINREVVAISFDGSGRVSNIERFGLQDGRVIALSQRVTRVTSSKRSLLQRLLGTLGQPSAGGLIN